MKIRKGFTLIELLVVIGVLSVVGSILTSTLIQTLRGQSKATVVSRVKQNGQVVLDKVSYQIRQAEKVICISDSDNTVVVFAQGVYSRFRLVLPTTSSNGYIEENDFTADDIPDQTLDSQLCSNSGNFGDKIYNLSDTDSVNGVSIDLDNSNPVFSRSSLEGYSDTVTIKFRAFEAVGSGSAYERTVKEGGVLFTTTVGVRGGK